MPEACEKTLNLDRADLQEIHQQAPQLYKRYQAIVRQLRNLENQEHSVGNDTQTDSPLDLRARSTEIRSELNAIIAEIRQIDGHENFLALPTFDQIATTVQPQQPLVYLLTTPQGGLGLILHRTNADHVNIHSVSLESFTETTLQNHLESWFGTYNSFRQNSQTHSQDWNETIIKVTEALWQPVMDPLLKALATLSVSQAVLIPTGLLSFLPLHAAWDPRR